MVEPQFDIVDALQVEVEVVLGIGATGEGAVVGKTGGDGAIGLGGIVVVRLSFPAHIHPLHIRPGAVAAAVAGFDAIVVASGTMICDVDRGGGTGIGLGGEQGEAGVARFLHDVAAGVVCC